LDKFDSDKARNNKNAQAQDFSGSLLDDLFSNKFFQLSIFVFTSVYLYTKMIGKSTDDKATT
jgi:hypothetical protein